MSAHTPGPWAQYADDALVIVNADGSSLGEMSAGDPYISDDEQFANARLTAAAPDLLNALRWALFAMQSRNPGCEDGENFQRAEAAIAKAEGRS